VSASAGPANITAATYPPMNNGPPSRAHSPMASARREASTRTTSASAPATPERTNRKAAAAASNTAATATDDAGSEAPVSRSAAGSRIATTPQVRPDSRPST
jgi:hypothetical protein